MTRDILNEGANWLKTMVSLHAQQDITIDYGTGPPVSVKASLVDEEGRILPGEVPHHTEHTMFMIETDDIEPNLITRNTRITWKYKNYRVVMRGNNYWTYNDTYRTHIVVATKHVPD